MATWRDSIRPIVRDKIEAVFGGMRQTEEMLVAADWLEEQGADDVARLLREFPTRTNRNHAHWQRKLTEAGFIESAEAVRLCCFSWSQLAPSKYERSWVKKVWRDEIEVQLRGRRIAENTSWLTWPAAGPTTIEN